jgi:GAF domain
VTREIADAFHAESCGIFLRGPTGRLDLRSHFGEGVNCRAHNTAESVAGEALTHVLPASAEAGACTLIAAPMVSRGRPIGAIVVQRGERSTYSTEEIRMLSAVASQIVGFIESGLAVETIAGVDTTAESFGTEKPSIGERILHGTAASPGIAVGVVAFREMFPRDLVPEDAQRPLAAAVNGCERDR